MLLKRFMSRILSLSLAVDAGAPTATVLIQRIDGEAFDVTYAAGSARYQPLDNVVDRDKLGRVRLDLECVEPSAESFGPSLSEH